MYYSSRNHQNKVEASRALVEGIASDGGLFLIEQIPAFQVEEADLKLSYPALTKKILGMYFDDFSEEEIAYCVDNAYTKENFNESFVEVKTFGRHSFLELFKGPTIAFKDMALTILPYLLQTAMEKQGINKVKILTATSGDTGSAALSAFCGQEKIDIAVLYPDHGISVIQEKQMLYFTSANSRAYSLKNGNFDDCQREVKKCLQQKDDEVMLSSANSINIGRLVPQIVYYYYGYIQLVNEGTIELGQPIDVIVPTGNFGNIFACYLAKSMGLPISKLVCASNENDVLDEFFKTGVYNSNRDFYITNSPSMDILVSSNLERLLALVSNEEQLNRYMADLKDKGQFEVDEEVKEKLKVFASFHSNQQETLAAMKKSFEEDNYLIDPHTAVGYDSFNKYSKETNNHCLIASTASFFKFPLTVKAALGLQGEDELGLLDEIVEVTGVDLPLSLQKVIACQTDKQFITEQQFEESLFAKKSFLIKAPASIANLACGFEVCCLSYKLFNEYSFKQAYKDEVKGFLPQYNNEDNLVLKSYKYVFEKNNLAYRPVEIQQVSSQVPDARGLGSSATCIVAGVMAANEMLNNKYPEEYLLEMMAQLEGHPDNVACCYFGQMVASFKQGQQYYFQQSKVSEDLKFILCIPDYQLSTSLARSVLPEKISIADATYDAGRLIQLPKALEEGNIELLATILDEYIHQPYRLGLMKDADIIQNWAQVNGLPFAVSGAGSTLLVISKSLDVIKQLEALPLSTKYEFVCLTVCQNGAAIIRELSMKDEYYLVHKSAVPDFFANVLAAKMMVETEGYSVSEACKKYQISRSTYYKYKDLIFYPDVNSSHKSIFSFVVVDQQGVLNQIITLLDDFNCNVLSINQNMPIQKLANITIMVDTVNADVGIEEMVNQFKQIEQVRSVEVVAHE